MVRVKVCGITNIQDALSAIDYGADALGFVFAPSPRQLTPEQVQDIVSQLPPHTCKVGVFVDFELATVNDIKSRCHLDIVQLHGSESPEYCQSLLPNVIKSFQVRDETILELLPTYRVKAYLLDSYHTKLKGGTGHSFDWSIAKKAKEYGPIILSGGLNPDNIRQAIAAVQPFAVDVSSGVEATPGKKDQNKLRNFLKAAKQVQVEKAKF
ncbi:MAG TPA: phosphoribosylanthranilate isomerase [Dehalococcoidia bacterium]|nr:phosphoribosylanthranilate isomerase [Dehalococcoidia bacterium]